MRTKRLLTTTIIICAALCALFIGYAAIYFLNPNFDNYIKIAIYPSSGGPSRTYYFILDIDNEKMSITKGTRSSEEIDLTKRYFMMGGRRFETEKEKASLTSDEINEITSLLDSIYADEASDNLASVTDTWGVAIYYNNGVLQNNSYQDSEELKELISLLCDKTSINMNLQGFA